MEHRGSSGYSGFDKTLHRLARSMGSSLGTLKIMAQQATSQIMSRDEFELRFTAYRGMKTRFRLEWDTEILINLTKRTDQGQLTHALNQTSVDELHLLTKQTYTPFKQQFITDQTDKKV